MDELIEIQQIVENISEGIISINNEQRINIINKKAKEIFGISYKYDIGHPAGKLNKGDIIIIGDNCIGEDDGGIRGSDFIKLGINENIPQKSAFVYIGEYGKENSYKYSENYSKGILSLSKIISGKNISVSINFPTKNIEICVDKTSISYSYIKSIGHIVILDKITKEIKFYQSKGYTIRGEAVKAIINEESYSEKISGKFSELEVHGEKIYDVLNDCESIKNLIEASKGKESRYINKFDDINGRPVRCSVYPLKNSKIQSGAFMRFEDLSNLREFIEERNIVINKIHEIEDSVNDPFNPLIGEGNEIKLIKEYSKKAALSNLNILILGESGTGKSILAKMIHNYSMRRESRFVEINCGALSESILESELFGYVPGAFTGANREGKVGLIEHAEGGTVFLDEISEMPVSTQVKLLHVIQNKSFIPVGGIKNVKIDVRFICASNRDLKSMIENRTFREDLYYRINVMPLMLPPLRSRKEDLEELVRSIIQKICKRDKIIYRELSPGALNKLYSYDFPGNVRELENLLERGLNLSEGEYILDEHILISDHIIQTIKPLKLVVEEAEKSTIKSYLKKFHGDKSLTMEALDIKKTAFYDKLKKYDIEV
jgi:sigma-54 dependent transcriptional regulator, acetoin dehydrogenase operon transcriptional activator AcoR